jgi:hypothetical protein
MIKININEFKSYDSKSIYEFLLLQNETEFEIIIPREAVEGINDQYELVTEFLSAAYAGHLLNAIATCFAYYTPCPNKTAPFYFQGVIADMEKLTDTLYCIIQGFNDPDGGDVFLNFHVSATDFLNDVYEEKIQCSTWGLVHIANNFLQE